MDYHIWKTKLEFAVIGEVQTVMLPPDSTVLSVGEQDGELVVWFQFPSANRGTQIPYRFLVAFTGGPTKFPAADMHFFQGSVQIRGFVFHVFLIVRGTLPQ